MPAEPADVALCECVGPVFEVAVVFGAAHCVSILPGISPRAYEWLRKAMDCYEHADAIRPPGNDDARLRWNACARLIMSDAKLAPASEERGEPLLLE